MTPFALLVLVTTSAGTAGPLEPFPTPTPAPPSGFSRAMEIAAGQLELFKGSLEEDFRLALPEHAPADVERARTILSARAEGGRPRLNFVLDARFSWLGHDPRGEARLTAPPRPWRVDADSAFAETNVHPGGSRVRFRAGIQTIRWGSGLLFNPTSAINAPDLDDPLRYGAPLGNMMVRAEWLGPLHVDAVGVPWFRPPLLPEIDDRQALLASGVAAARTIARDPSWTIALDSRAPDPPRTLDDVAGALRIGGRIPGIGVDASLMGYRGRLHVPQLARADLTADFAGKSLTGTTRLVFPRVSIVGGDLAGQIPAGAFGDLGAWAEGAWVVPEPMSEEVVANGLPGSTRVLTVPYLRAAAGLDHTFGDETYLALEYVRGFPDEVGAAAQGNYLVGIVDRTLFRQRAHVRIVGATTLTDGSVLVSPELSWHADAATLSLGAWTSAGSRDAKLGRDRLGPPVVVARVSLSF